MTQTSPLRRSRLQSGVCKAGKPRGADRLPAEFYSRHVNLLAPRLKVLFSEFADTDSLLGSMEEAIIVLIPKPGKNSQEGASYGPISLLNVDVKVLAKILDTHLSVISTLIHVDQTMFMPGKGTDKHQTPFF